MEKTTRQATAAKHIVVSRQLTTGKIQPRLAVIEHCCEMLKEAVEGEAILSQPRQEMRGRILNEVDSDYAVRSPEDRPNLYLLNFCPFCGRGISRTIWNAEKKK